LIAGRKELKFWDVAAGADVTGLGAVVLVVDRIAVVQKRFDSGLVIVGELVRMRAGSTKFDCDRRSISHSNS
jgi:hypothetical protein